MNRCLDWQVILELTDGWLIAHRILFSLHCGSFLKKVRRCREVLWLHTSLAASTAYVTRLSPTPSHLRFLGDWSGTGCPTIWTDRITWTTCIIQWMEPMLKNSMIKFTPQVPFLTACTRAQDFSWITMRHCYQTMTTAVLIYLMSTSSAALSCPNTTTLLRLWWPRSQLSTCGTSTQSYKD